MFIDQSNGLVFSDYYSDISGFSIFDLNLDQEIAKFPDLEDEPIGFYKVNGQYYVSFIDVQNQKIMIKSVDLSNKKLVPSDLQISDVKGEELEFLFQPTDQ